MLKGVVLMTIKQEPRKKIVSFIFKIICILLFLWTILSGAEMWLNCIILDSNNYNVSRDVLKGNFTEVSTVYKDESFVLEGESKRLSKKDVSSYVRVPKGDRRYYYNKANKQFVAPLNDKESRDIFLKFFILDVVFSIILIYIVIYCLGRKIQYFWCFSIFLIIYTIFFYIGVNYCFDVLYGTTNWLWVIPVTKLSLLSISLIVATVIKDKKKEKRLSN